jgi:hypothetical protein
MNLKVAALTEVTWQCRQVKDRPCHRLGCPQTEGWIQRTKTTKRIACHAILSVAERTHNRACVHIILSPCIRTWTESHGDPILFHSVWLTAMSVTLQMFYASGSELNCWSPLPVMGLALLTPKDQKEVFPLAVGFSLKPVKSEELASPPLLN